MLSTQVLQCADQTQHNTGAQQSWWVRTRWNGAIIHSLNHTLCAQTHPCFAWMFTIVINKDKGPWFSADFKSTCPSSTNYAHILVRLTVAADLLAKTDAGRADPVESWLRKCALDTMIGGGTWKGDLAGMFCALLIRFLRKWWMAMGTLEKSRRNTRNDRVVLHLNAVMVHINISWNMHTFKIFKKCFFSSSFYIFYFIKCKTRRIF